MTQPETPATTDEGRTMAPLHYCRDVMRQLDTIPLDAVLEHVVAQQFAPDADHQALADAEQAVRAAVVFRDVGRTLAMTPAERSAALDTDSTPS